jgi:hypothetical protein
VSTPTASATTPSARRTTRTKSSRADRRTAIRDELIHGVAQGKKTDLVVDDSKTLVLPPVPTNFKPSEKNGNPTEFLSGEAAIEKMKLAPGYKVSLFASEEKFPDLKKPVQMSFDAKGRLWVATTPTYPHYRPGESRCRTTRS